MASRGAVRLGVPLYGAERKASLARGGNGTVAKFAGGYLLAAAPGGAGLRGDAMSLCRRVRDPTGRWDAPLLARDDRGDPLAAILYGIDGAAKPLHYGSAAERGPATPWYHLFAERGGPYRLAGSRALLEYQWRTRPAAPVIGFNEDGHAGDPILGEARAGVLHLSVPVALVRATAWHDVVAVHVDSHRQRVAICGPLDWASSDGGRAAMQPVAGLDRPYTLDLIVIGGIVDLCVDHRYTVVARRAGPAGPELRLSAAAGSVLVSEVSVRPLTGAPHTVRHP
ncbi:MAG: hypothetical protein OXJ62_06565 [Spirochaetaceae bacterium]|nr:hypothetical protein [Spirochaetaceae bacterium]